MYRKIIGYAVLGWLTIATIGFGVFLYLYLEVSAEAREQTDLVKIRTQQLGETEDVVELMEETIKGYEEEYKAPWPKLKKFPNPRRYTLQKTD